LKKIIKNPVVIRPFESLRYVIPERDKSGGSGANFMVEWISDKPVILNGKNMFRHYSLSESGSGIFSMRHISMILPRLRSALTDW